MTVTVACPRLPLSSRRAVTSGGGAGEGFVHGRPGDGVRGAGPDHGRQPPVDHFDGTVHPDATDLDSDHRDAGPDAGIDAGLDADLDADAAIARLYQTQWTPLVRLAALLTRDASMAEEIVQDALVQLHQRWEHLADRAAAHAYLRTSVVNRARSALRHRGVEERHRQPGSPAPAGPEERAVQAAADAQVMAALRTLSRRQQEVLVLRYYGDFSEQDIATTLGLSKGAVKSHAHRGLAALRLALDGSGVLPPGRAPGGRSGEVAR